MEESHSRAGSQYTLIIAEKPDVAARIAQALDEDDNLNKTLSPRKGFFEVRRGNKRIIVAPALGHLYTITHQSGGRNSYPVYTIRWVPKYEVEKGSGRTKKCIALIEKLSQHASEFVNAADYDIEGSLIGYTILKYACHGKEKVAKRMRFSTLTKEELTHAYENLLPHLDFEMVEAGRTRHEVDWIYGINLSRALTLASLRKSKRYNTLSVGRVQGPTLKLVVDREREIKSFVPTPYYQIQAQAEFKGAIYKFLYEKDKVERKAEGEAISKRCLGKTGVVRDVQKHKTVRYPPQPFDLGSLQRECYRFFNYAPRRALDIAERLYLDALISYPRTSSQKLPPSINYRRIFAGLSENPRYSQSVQQLLARGKLVPHEGKREDPAHPAVYPTGNQPERSLPADQARVYDLIVKRFMATFAESSYGLATRVIFDCEGYRFLLYGSHILAKGWTLYYQPYADSDEIILPPIEINDTANFIEVNCMERFIDPPPRYNPASLLKAMEDDNIGTKATRADIVNTLYERGYIRDERIIATDIGFSVVESLENYCPTAVSVEFTRTLEEKMEEIECNASDRKHVLVESVEALTHALTQLKTHEESVGSELAQAIRLEETRKRTVGPCLACKTGDLMIITSRRTGKRFIGCTNYFKGTCSKSFPLPQKGFITPTQKVCKICGWSTLLIRYPYRRLYASCINNQCPSHARKNHTSSTPPQSPPHANSGLRELE